MQQYVLGEDSCRQNGVVIAVSTPTWGGSGGSLENIIGRMLYGDKGVKSGAEKLELCALSGWWWHGGGIAPHVHAKK